MSLVKQPQWTRVSSLTRFLDHKQRQTTVGRTPLDEGSARHRDLYLTTHNTHNRQTSMPPVGFEPTVSAGEGRQTYALDRAATGTGCYVSVVTYCSSSLVRTHVRIMLQLASLLPTKVLRMKVNLLNHPSSN